MAGKSSAFDPCYSAVASRLRDDLLQTPEDTKKLAEYLGCSVQAISQYKNGLATPKMENLISIAHYFGCSLDYLIGLSDVRTPSADIQAMCEYTGLSEKAIKQLHVLSMDRERNQTSDAAIDGTNILLENVAHGSNGILAYISEYVRDRYTGFAFTTLDDKPTKFSNTVTLCDHDKPVTDVSIGIMRYVILSWIQDSLTKLHDYYKGGKK